jgi:carbonic anhydrase
MRNTVAYFKKCFGNDLLAGMVVFLVAIPLCMGIALAANAPAYSGIISGIAGGIVVGFLSNSRLSVSGPSAAIIAIILSAYAQLHHFEVVLLSIFIAGIFQLIAGLKKWGFIGDFIPNNVIMGMLSAIGVLLIINQLPIAFTVYQTVGDLKTVLIDSTEGEGFRWIHDINFHLNEGGLVLTIVSLTLLWLLEKPKTSWIKEFPKPILVVIIGVLLNQWFIDSQSSLAQESNYLVNIPEFNSLKEIWLNIAKPDWSYWLEPKVYLYAGLIAIVVSLETLMNVSATEKVDPKHQIINKDRELVAQGFGNIISAVLGGIPLSSVIVRTSVNIQANAKTKVSTILHGIFLLITFCFFPKILNKIPLSVLASVLIFTGFKLTRPIIYKNIFKEGFNRFLPFIATLLGVIFINLVLGIIIGLAIHLIFILRTNSKTRIDIIEENYPKHKVNRLVLPQQTTFLNKSALVTELNDLPKGSQLIIDARFADFIDNEIIDFIKVFKDYQAPKKDLSLNLIGFKDNYTIKDHINFINVTSFDTQSSLTPEEVLDILKQGNERFLNDQAIHRSNLMDIKDSAKTQHPIAVVLGCIDSRVPVETVFDMTFGDLFCVRIAGNIINKDILGSIEYACHVVGAKLIVVMGHTACGAINAACNHFKEGNITHLLEKIQPAVQIQEKISKNIDKSFVDQVTHLNIAQSMAEVSKQSPILEDLLKENKVAIVGALYDVNTGRVTFSDYKKERAFFLKD